jgi:hypothetical protein
LHLEALFPPPLVLAAFDQERLDLWFRGLAAQTPEKSFIFRQADNGNLVVDLDKVAALAELKVQAALAWPALMVDNLQQARG